MTSISSEDSGMEDDGGPDDSKSNDEELELLDIVVEVENGDVCSCCGRIINILSWSLDSIPAVDNDVEARKPRER